MQITVVKNTKDLSELKEYLTEDIREQKVLKLIEGKEFPYIITSTSIPTIDSSYFELALIEPSMFQQCLPKFDYVDTVEVH